jgi:hypothetical protein
VSSTIKVSKETKDSLTKVAARLQEKSGKRVDLDEAIQHLLSASSQPEEKKPALLDRLFGSVPHLSVKDLRSERRLDEQRFRRKYRI